VEIYNRHERAIAAPPEWIAELLEDFDRFWPTDLGPAPRPRGHGLYETGSMLWQEFHRPGAVRAFRVVRPDVLRVEHWFEVERVDGGTVLRHIVEGSAVGQYAQVWSEREAPEHDDFLEALLDHVAARAATAADGPASADSRAQPDR
jgi:hypothetical protein